MAESGSVFHRDGVMVVADSWSGLADAEKLLPRIVLPCCGADVGDLGNGLAVCTDIKMMLDHIVGCAGKADRQSTQEP